MFDELTSQLEDFAASEADSILAIKTTTIDQVFAPLKKIGGKCSSVKKSYDILYECRTVGESLFESIAMNHSFEALLACLRRFPTPTDSNEIGIMTRGIVAYGGRIDATQSEWVEMGTGSRGLMFHLDEDTLFDCFRLYFIADALARVVSFSRWVGKGSRVTCYLDGQIGLDAGESLITAISDYERRRPKIAIFQDTGVPIVSDIYKAHDEIIFFRLAPAEFRVFAPSIKSSLLLKYLPHPISAKQIESVLQLYAEPLADIEKLSVNSVMHVLVALTILVSRTLLWPIESASGHIEFPPLDLPDDNNHRLSFSFDLYHKGYLRFPKKYLVDAISDTPTKWAAGLSDRRQLTEDAIDKLIAPKESLRSVDLITGANSSFMYKDNDDAVFIDFLIFQDYFRDLIENCKDWYGTVHGDRFTLWVKSLLISKFKQINIRYKVPVVLDRGVSDADLLIDFGSELLLVECKAFAKTNEHFLGDPRAVNERRSRIRKAVRQATRNANLIQKVISKERNKATEVRWAVCSPSQEFLLPMSEYGMLTPNIPTVLTPEELIAFCGTFQNATQSQHERPVPCSLQSPDIE